jgi:HK97 family phage major capsid protein
MSKQKIMLQLDGGKEVDLNEVLAEASLDQLKEMGFPIENGKVDFSKFSSAAVKTESQEKAEALAEAANFIKFVALPSAKHAQFGVKSVEVKQITTDAGSFGAAVPTALANAILEKKAKFAILRSRAFSFELSGSFDLPVEGDGITGYWVGETDTEDANLVTESHPTLAKKSLGDHYLAALVKVSWKLLNTSDYNIVNFIASLAGKALAETEEAAFIGGNGTGKPKGIRTETLEDIAQEGAGLVYQDLVNLYFLLPAQYRQNAVWITSSMGAKAITGLKDSQDRPIFQPGMPLDELFRKPILESVDIPENLGTGTDTTEIYFGDPYYYWIKDGQSLAMASQDVIERLQTKVLVYQAVDGKLTLTDAFVKMTGVKAVVES